MRRFLGLGLLTLWLLGCSGLNFVGYRVAPNYPKDKDRNRQLEGLHAPVTIVLDGVGVPHIKAANELDLLRAVGYMHGRDRFFQMDLLRRMARGRVSELLGEQPMQGQTTVDLDRTMRGWGFDAAAEAEAGAMDDELWSRMAAYVDGVNQGLARKRPIEYRLLRIRPEPWQVSDSLAVGLLTAFSITHNWKQETFRLLLALEGGIQRMEALYPPTPWSGKTTITLTDEAHPLPPSVVPGVAELFPAQIYQEEEDLAVAGFETDPVMASAASDGWVIGGAHTVSGMPILANDPHLTHLVPSMFYQQHLTTPEIDVIGITVPGIPYVLVGHNRHVAWGLTSAVADVCDLYLERPSPDNPAAVMGPAGPEPLERDSVVIRIREKKNSFTSRRFALRRTRRGPLLNDLYPGLLPERAPPVSVKWDIRGVAEGVAGYRAANLATDLDSLFAALHQVKAPVNTVLAADTTGAIGLSTTGRVPLRLHHRGTFPVPAWQPEYDWPQMIDTDTMPRVVAGKEGKLAHANNLMFDMARSPILFQIDSAPSYRLERSLELIDGPGPFSTQTELQHQLDVQLLRGKKLAPFILGDLETGPWNDTERAALEALQAWDYQGAPDRPGAAIFFATYRHAALTALRDEVSSRAFAFILALPYPYVAFDQWFLDADHPAWDHRGTPAVEHRREVVRDAFARSVGELAQAQGPDPATWRWGALHFRQFKHLFGSKKALAKVFNLPQSEAAGGEDALARSHFALGNPETPFRSVGGAVLRMVIDLADLDHGRWVIETGASGWPGSPHYQDQHELWREGQTAPMLFDWDEITASKTAILSLEPATDDQELPPETVEPVVTP